MKRTVEILDSRLEQAKRLAAREHTTVRALMEEGLRRLMAERAQPAGPLNPNSQVERESKLTRTERTPHPALPRLRERHPLPKGEGRYLMCFWCQPSPEGRRRGPLSDVFLVPALSREERVASRMYFWSQPSPEGRGWPAVPMHFIGKRAGPSPAEGLLALSARSPLRPAGG